MLCYINRVLLITPTHFITHYSNESVLTIYDNYFIINETLLHFLKLVYIDPFKKNYNLFITSRASSP